MRGTKKPTSKAGHPDQTRRTLHPFMKDHVYKLIELTGTSTTTIEDAVEHALSRARKTLNNLRWFQVTETRGSIEKGKIQHWQVTIKVGFSLEA